MKRRLVLAAIALVLVVDGLVLASVAWNRSGEPAAELALTERELAPPYTHWPRKEDSGIGLRISRALQEFDWLDRQKLADLGLNPDRYHEQPPSRWRSVDRPVWVVLEFDGPAFDELLVRQRERLERRRAREESGEFDGRAVEVEQQRLERLVSGESRLMAVDAGHDRDDLGARYPDRSQYAIVRGMVRMHAVQRAGQETPSVRGRITRVLPGQVHVPRRFHHELAAALEQPRVQTEAPPRYRATLRYGRKGEPWLAGIEKMSTEEVGSD